MKHRVITNGYGYRVEFKNPNCGNWFPIKKHRMDPWRCRPWQSRWLWRARLKALLETKVDEWHDRWVKPIWDKIEAWAKRRNDWSKPTVVEESKPRWAQQP